MAFPLVRLTLSACVFFGAGASAHACDREAASIPMIPLQRGVLAEASANRSLLRGLVRHRAQVATPSPARAASSRQLKQLVRVDRMIASGLSLDTSCVKVMFLDSDEFDRRYRSMVGRIHAHEADEVAGFHMPGLVTNNTVFVRLDDEGNAADSVVVHELLHAMSRRFSADGDTRRYRQITEGLTEWFSREVRLKAGEAIGAPDVYEKETEFAGALANAIGRPALRRSFFFEDFDALARKVQHRTGSGAFYEAARAIEHGDLSAALEVLR